MYFSVPKGDGGPAPWKCSSVVTLPLPLQLPFPFPLPFNNVHVLTAIFKRAFPIQIRWRPVIWGYSLQFVFAVLVLRWQPGYEAVKWLSEVITKFVNFAYDGAAVTFGDPWMIFHAFAFMVSIK